jgi:hypothetical protein
MFQPRILGRVNREAFIGREAALRQIARHASAIDDSAFWSWPSLTPARLNSCGRLTTSFSHAGDRSQFTFLSNDGR